MRIGISAGLGRGATLDNILAQFERAERDSFASVWLANIFGIDARVDESVRGRIGKVKALRSSTDAKQT